MGEMKREHIGRLGPIGIIRRAFEILWRNGKQLFFVQLALCLPYIILATAVSWAIMAYAPIEIAPDSGEDTASSPAPAAAVPIRHTLHNLAIEVNTTALLWMIPVGFLTTLIYSLIMQAIQSVSMSVNVLAVGMDFSGRDFEFVPLVKESIPRLWKRMVVTFFIWQLIEWIVIVVYAILIFLTMDFLTKLSTILTIVVMVALQVLLFWGIIYLTMIYMVASGVCILDREENYGWAGLKKARQLLDGKKWTAFFILLIYIIPQLLISSLTSSSRGNQWGVLSIILSILGIIFNSLFFQLTTVVGAVAYASFKNHHREPFAENLTEEGYQPLPDDADPEG